MKDSSLALEKSWLCRTVNFLNASYKMFWPYRITVTVPALLKVTPLFFY